MNSEIPTDSVLRRHYEATHNQTSQNKTTKNNSDFMCWLKKNFGG